MIVSRCSIASFAYAALVLPVLTGCHMAQYSPPPPPPPPVMAMDMGYLSGGRTAYVEAKPKVPAPATDSFNTESYDEVEEIPFRLAKQHPLSTFSADVDTASYANVRRLLNSGNKVPPGAVRVEEMVNYFTYDYPQPSGPHPFSVNTAVASCPWAPEHKLVRIGLRGRVIQQASRPAANLVFLVDVSGSMEDENKLPLVQRSLRLLVEDLQPRDRIAIAVYAGAAGLVLPSTPCSDKRRIFKAIDDLESGGSTNGGQGIQLAYATAKQHFIPGGINRVVMATDGDFNVGVTDEGSLVKLVQQKAKGGIYLSVLGFGMGNYKDSTLEALADKGDGNYAYIDTLKEARKVLVKQAAGSLITIAKDVKLQVEFNPAHVAAYRLLGYENRKLEDQDFANDKKDAGEIGAGHTVTALYEIIPAGQAVPGVKDIPLKYSQTATPTAAAAASGELLTVKLRYKQPGESASRLLQQAVADSNQEFKDADSDFRFATAVTAFGMKLRGSPHAKNISGREIRFWASKAVGKDEDGYRREFVGLAKKL